MPFGRDVGWLLSVLRLVDWLDLFSSATSVDLSVIYNDSVEDKGLTVCRYSDERLIKVNVYLNVDSFYQQHKTSSGTDYWR